MRGILLLLALAVTLRVHGRVCLPDAIPESERTHVVVDGTSMPLGIWTGSWASARIVSSIYEIIVQEKIGHNTSLGIGTTSFIQIYKLAGCEHIPENNTIIEGSCAAERHQPRQHHVSLEYWYAAEELTETALKKLGEYAPENLGSIGYSGKEGMYIMGSSMNAALQDSGLALEFYRSWNRSWHNPVQYTATVPQVDLAKLRTCADSVEIGFEGIGGQYLAATGDHDGVEEINNKTVLKCWQQRWWLAPACRHNASECATVVTANVGWGLPYMIQQAFWHNMPIAFATAQKTPVDWYIPLNTELESLLYWWVPDTNFALYNPAQVLFPPNSRSQYKRQIYKTMKENTLLTNWAAKGFADIAYKAADVAKNMNIADEDIQALLVKYTKGSQDPWEAACEWLKNNDLWLEWLPNNTACIKGKGLVDSDGKFVQQRGLAVDCAMCPVGTQSVEQDDTRVCVDCEPGQYQDLPGESTCSPCQPGTRAEEPGARECKPCGLGLYANESGMTSCFQCGLEDQRELWTTSQLVNNETYIQIQGAFSETSCSCVPGTYLWNGRCEECIDGSYCPGSNNLLLEMGYFSTPEAPGEVFRCFEQAGRCPGGRPGTCAPGRDNQSIACAACLPGLHTTGDTCEVCSEGNYAMLALVGILCGSGISVLYVVLVYEGQKSRQPGSLLIAALSMGQMVTVVQQLTVIQQFKIEWGSPFSDILAAMELLAFDLDMVSISCVAPMSPVAKFTTRTLLVLLFFAMAGLVHVGYLAYKRAKTLQLGLLGRTVGTLFMVFFISLCSSLLAPFRCNMHPNGRWTVQTYHQVFCNGQDEHLAMVLVGTAACLLPICFVVICIWIILFELPKRLERADVHFIRACSFLFIRFRPGAEVFSVIFLVRNALVVLCPLLPSAAAKVVCMNILLYGSVVVTAFSKPWRVMACNFLDLLLVTGMLVILDMGSLFVQQENTVVTTVICMAFFSIMLVAIFGAILYGIAKHFLLKYRKQFRFFLCHQKVAAGSLARLLKMELQKRGSRFTTFVDCDDLNDLTRLFSYVGQDTETLVVLASPDILTRKWCVGEICTARIQRVETVVVAFPEYANPDKTFIESYSSIVPDITELANYNLGLVEVEETLRWISTLQTIALPALLTADAVDSLVTDLSGTFKAKSTTASSCPDCIILADLDNLEAAATAYIMLGLLLPKLVGGSHNSMPTVLKKDQKMPKSATSALMICSEGCFRSADVASNLLAVKDLKTCCILPIIAEDGFRFPSQAFYEDLVTNRQLSSLDLQSYVQIIKAIFQEIAVVFSPQNYSSTQEDLELRSKQVVWRLQSGDLKPLSSKLATEVSEPSPEPSVEQPLKPLGQAEQVPKVDERSDLVETANAPPMPDKIEPWESEENFSCATIISQEL